jgi:hypothetical protein
MSKLTKEIAARTGRTRTPAPGGGTTIGVTPMFSKWPLLSLEILTYVTVQVAAPCTLIDGYYRFGGSCCLYPQGRTETNENEVMLYRQVPNKCHSFKLAVCFRRSYWSGPSSVSSAPPADLS